MTSTIYFKLSSYGARILLSEIDVEFVVENTCCAEMPLKAFFKFLDEHNLYVEYEEDERDILELRHKTSGQYYGKILETK